MKTTIHIADGLFEEARKLARREKNTLKALVDEGLRKVVAERQGQNPGAFKLRRGSFKGGGLQPRLAGATWDQILAIGYEERGG